jgi:hypothetical protein
MPPVHHIFFRLAGVVTQTFEQAALEALFSAAAREDAEKRLTLHDWVIEMQFGRLTLADYSAQAARLAQCGLSAVQAYEAVSACLKTSVPMSDLLNEITRQFDLWLVCEADRLRMLPALQRLGLSLFFQPDRWIFSPELGKQAQIPQIIPELLSISMAGLGELLWVDNRSMVDSAAIRAGLNAVAYVDPYRFRRNLVLRGMIETNVGGHQKTRQ